MNTLLCGLVMFFGLDTASVQPDENYCWVLDEMKIESELILDVELPENTIQVYDAKGNFFGEYSEERFIKNELPLSDLIQIHEYEFLFEYDGVSYYLKG